MFAHLNLFQPRACVCVIAAATTLLLAACQHGASLPSPDEPAASASPVLDSTEFRQLPPPSQLRTTSAASSWYLDEGIVVDQGGLIDEDGLISHQNTTDLSYRIYRLGQYTPETAPRLATLHCGGYRSTSLQVYFGVADFTRNTWRWHEDLTPNGTEATTILGRGDFIDPETGEALLAIAWYGKGGTQTSNDRGLLFGGAVNAHLETVTLSTEESLAEIEGCNVVGNLYISSGFVDFSELSNLDVVLGDLSISNSIAETIELPQRLQYIASSFASYGCVQTQEISLPGVRRIGHISLRANPELRSFSSPELTRCGEGNISYPSWMAIYSLDNGALTQIDAPNLVQLDGNLEITQYEIPKPVVPGVLLLPKLRSARDISISYTDNFFRIDLPILETADSIELRSSAISEIELPNLQTVSNLEFRNNQINSLSGIQAQLRFNDHGKLIINNCPLLTSLSDFGSMGCTGSMHELTISMCPGLANLSGIEWITGNVHTLSISLDSTLTDVSALSGISSVGYLPYYTMSKRSSQGDPPNPGTPDPEIVLRVSGNDLLADLSPLNLDYINGGVDFSDNANLANLSGWYTGTSLDKLVVDSNPKLADLTGLDSLVEIGVLHITSNPMLASIHGLDNLAVCNKLVISGNPVLQDINELTNLRNEVDGVPVGMRLITITGNASLHSLTGLQNLQASQYGHVTYYFTVQDNPSLIGGDQAAWDLINAWGGESVIGGEISISGNET